jgi:SAM-dependent methyltransferase
MQVLVQEYLDPKKPLEIIDIGSLDVNGSYKPLFANPLWHYQGIDLEAGNNVDIVLESPYTLPLPDDAIDLVISGQAFEHVEFFWEAFKEIVRVLKPNGLAFIIAPSRGPEHRYPVDCWRFYPDGFRALAKYAGVHCLAASTDWINTPQGRTSQWGDTVGVFCKGTPIPRQVASEMQSGQPLEYIS